MKKRILSIIMVAVMVLSVCACSNNDITSESTDTEETTMVSNSESVNTEESTQESDEKDQSGSMSVDIRQDTIPEFVQAEFEDITVVKDAVCLKLGSPYALVFCERKQIDGSNEAVAPIDVDGEAYVPAEFITEAFGDKFDIKDTDKNAVKDVEGTVMVSLSTVKDILGKQVIYDEDMGLIAISDETLDLNRERHLEEMIDICQLIVLDRPSVESIAADIKATAPDHPRLMATASDFDRIRDLVTTDALAKMCYEGVLSIADKYVKLAADGEAKPVYAMDDGGRLANDYSIVDRATSLGMAWQVTGEQKYIDAMWYMLENICDRTKWEHWHPGHFLNAAEVMSGVAIAYDWMYDGWSDGQRSMIEEALFDCGIEDGLASYYGTMEYAVSDDDGAYGWRSGWFKKDGNWNAVCNSGVLLAGVAMVTHDEYGDLAAKAISFALQSVENGTRCYAPDGGYEEGVMYWSYGTSELIMLMAAIESAAGTTYGLAELPGLGSTYATPVYSESKQGSFNYSDGSVSRTDTSSLFWFGMEYDDPQINGIRYNELMSKEKLTSYKDLLWYDPSKVDTGANLELDYSFYLTHTATMRSSWNDNSQLFVGLHGGLVDTTHANLDTGTFVLDALGTRWFIDLGSDNYNLPGYFLRGEDGQRWNYYSQRAEGSNTIVINPDSGPDQVTTATAVIEEFVSEPKGAYVTMDLTEVYGNDVSKATRGIMLGDNRKEIVIQDEIEMLKPSEFYWFGHTKAEIEVAADGRSAVLTQESRKLYAEIISDDENLKFSVMDAVSLPTSPVPDTGTQKEISREGIRKLVVYGSGVEKINMAIVFRPFVGDDTPVCEYTYTSLNEWSIPEGELVVPKLESISVAGKEIKGFDRNVTGYDVVLSSDTVNVPEITAVADSESDYVITLPIQLPGTATIKVVDKEDNSMYSTYSLFMRVAKELEIEASNYQEGNPPENCLDKDLSTRWAVEGEAWAIFRFGSPKELSSVNLAWWRHGRDRQQIFDIEVSEDGENFIQVWSGQSSGTEDILEEYKIPEGTYLAVKVVLHGTTNGTWNSLLEAEFK